MSSSDSSNIDVSDMIDYALTLDSREESDPSKFLNVYLNVPIVGAHGVGKSSLIDSIAQSKTWRKSGEYRLIVEVRGFKLTLDIHKAPAEYDVYALLRQASGVILAFDVTSVESVNGSFNKTLLNGLQSNVPVVLVGCKSDAITIGDPAASPAVIAASEFARLNNLPAPLLVANNLSAVHSHPNYAACLAPFQQLAERLVQVHDKTRLRMMEALQPKRLTGKSGKIGVRLQAYLEATRKRYASWELIGKPLSAFFVRNEYDRICKTLQRHHRELQTENLKMPIELFIEMMSFLPPPISPTDRGFVCDAVPKIAMTCMMGLLLVRENASLKSAQPLYE